LDFVGEARFVFEHALGDVTEEKGFLQMDGPVHFALPEKLHMLNLIFWTA